MSAGKGDKPRNCFSKDFKYNFDYINWGRPKTIDEVCGNPIGTFKKIIKKNTEFNLEQEKKRRKRILNSKKNKVYQEFLKNKKDLIESYSKDDVCNSCGRLFYVCVCSHDED